mgnify:CR=1 FL=1
MEVSIRKGILILIISVISGFCLAGCHGKPSREGFEVPESFSDDKQIELTFWAKNDTNKIQTEIYEKAIADFEKLYPNIKVNIRLYTDYGRIYNDVITNISTGTTPNVCITYPDHIATYMTFYIRRIIGIVSHILSSIIHSIRINKIINIANSPETKIMNILSQ